MSETPPRLNLIERAMRKAALRPGQSIPRDQAQVSEPQRLVTHPRETLEPLATRTLQANVHINTTRLRQGRIMVPGARDTVTYNEFRMIKRKIFSLAQDPKTRNLAKNVFMVSSALPGEGKTFTTMNMALSLAAARDLDVIVVDGDIVRSGVSQYFDGPHEKGLLDLLTGECQRIDEVLLTCSDHPNLHVMFAGTRREVPLELFASQRMSEICGALSKLFPQSIVIIDTPPVLANTGIVALARDVDHVIMVVSAEQATRHYLDEALQVVATCPSVNLLFNKSPEWQQSMSSHYYYDYHDAP